MNFKTITRRVAATGGVTALAAGALVGATTTAAQADPVAENDYVCSAMGQNFGLNLVTNAPGIENFPQYPAGAAIPGGFLSVTNVFTVSAAVYGFMNQVGVETISIPTFAGTIGSTPVPVDGVEVTLANFTDNGDGTYTSSTVDGDGNTLPDEGTGLVPSFVTPVAGTYDILSPASLALVATTASSTIDVTCALPEGTAAGKYHTLTLVRNATTTQGAPTKAKFVKGKAAKVAATVTGGQQLDGDEVVLKLGKKTLDDAELDETGKAVLSTKDLPVGKSTVTVVYKKTGYNEGSKSEKIAVKVVR